MDEDQKAKVEQSMQAAKQALKELEKTMAQAKIASEQGSIYMDKLKGKIGIPDEKVSEDAWRGADKERLDKLQYKFLTNIGGERLSSKDVDTNMKQVSDILEGKVVSKSAKTHKASGKGRIRL